MLVFNLKTTTLGCYYHLLFQRWGSSSPQCLTNLAWGHLVTEADPECQTPPFGIHNIFYNLSAFLSLPSHCFLWDGQCSYCLGDYKVLPHTVCPSQTALLAFAVEFCLGYPFHLFPRLAHPSGSSSPPLWNLSNLRSFRLPLNSVQLTVETSLWPAPQTLSIDEIIHTLYTCLPLCFQKCENIFFSLLFIEK